MSTTRLGLPTITGNMANNVPRDLNALAEAVDEKAGVASGLATLGADGILAPEQRPPIPEVKDASTTQKGIVQLSTSTSSTSTTTAATPSAVKSAYDKAVSAETKAGSVESGLASHLAEKASLTAEGHVRLSSETNSIDETMAATPKAVKAVKDAIPVLNNTVTSTSTTQAATANAVKQAFDKAVAAGVVTGIYTGNGATSQKITLGFQPSAVFVIPENSELYDRGQSKWYGGLTVGSNPALGQDMMMIAKIEIDGFTVFQTNGNVLANDTSSKFNPYRYIAFR